MSSDSEHHEIPDTKITYTLNGKQTELGVTPFLLAVPVVAVILTAFPQIALLLPNMMAR
jgi:TRAP-type C4-dicarboxylate transport system permease large subunit